VRVYVIGQEAGPSKVGIASSVERHLRDLQTGNHLRLKVMAVSQELTLSEARRAERQAHVLLREKRLFGEWFNVDELAAVSMMHPALARPKPKPRARISIDQLEALVDRACKSNPTAAEWSHIWRLIEECGGGRYAPTKVKP
jgi:hypothetical protein